MFHRVVLRLECAQWAPACRRSPETEPGACPTEVGGECWPAPLTRSSFQTFKKFPRPPGGVFCLDAVSHRLHAPVLLGLGHPQRLSDNRRYIFPAVTIRNERFGELIGYSGEFA